MIFGGVDMFDALLNEVIDRALVALSQRSCDEAAKTQRNRRHYFLRPDREYMRVFLDSLLNKQVQEPHPRWPSPAR
jgi:hypothetical protein